MTRRYSVISIVAAAITVAGLCWLVSNVNTHGDHVQLGVISHLRYTPQTPVTARMPEPNRLETAGLDMIEMYECMCPAPMGTDIRGWWGLWLVTALIGGLPTAVLARSAANYAKREGSPK